MSKSFTYAKLGDSRKETLKVLKEKSMDFIYVTDQDRKFKGYITIEQLKKSKAETIDKLVKEDDTVIYRKAYLYEAWPKLKEATYDLPVVDQKGRLRGILDYNVVVDALA